MMSTFDPMAIGTALAAVLQEITPSTGFGGAVEAPAALRRGLRFLAGAYTVIWVILAVYLMSLSVRLRRVKQQVQRLKERLGG